MAKPILVSGIQPSGRLHLGNYLGALKHFVELQNSGKYQCYFFIADLHSLTSDYEPKEKAEQILELTADYLAAGLDPHQSTIYLQSLIPAHSELAWIFNTITPMGELSRMTQFRDKTVGTVYGKAISGEMSGEEMKEDINEHTKKVLREKLQESLDASSVGLFDYPVLMAADIVMYDASFVPVGDDQDQHLELARTIARKFNKRFGKTFIEPKALHTKTPRVMSLGDPEKKMSKSLPHTCLFLDDEPEAIKKKIMSAVTDSGTEIVYDEEKKPGMSNLLGIYSELSGKSISALEKSFAGLRYSDFKASLAELVTDHFASFRERKKNLLAHPAHLRTILSEGSAKAELLAKAKIENVKKKVGLAL